MPLQRRLPKFGFVSRKARFSGEVRVGDLGFLDADTIDLAALKAAKIVARRRQARQDHRRRQAGEGRGGQGHRRYPGARKAIEAAGGKVEDA